MRVNIKQRNRQDYHSFNRNTPTRKRHGYEKRCAWRGCEYVGMESGGQSVSGVFFCWSHVLSRLQDEVIGHLKKLRKGDREVYGSLRNRFARLFSGAPGIITGRPNKADIEERARDFHIDGTNVQFLIDRHPVGRVYVQEWVMDVKDLRTEMLKEELVESEFELRGGDFLCPECQEVGTILEKRGIAIV